MIEQHPAAAYWFGGATPKTSDEFFDALSSTQPVRLEKNPNRVNQQAQEFLANVLDQLLMSPKIFPDQASIHRFYQKLNELIEQGPDEPLMTALAFFAFRASVEQGAPAHKNYFVMLIRANYWGRMMEKLTGQAIELMLTDHAQFYLKILDEKPTKPSRVDIFQIAQRFLDDHNLPRVMASDIYRNFIREACHFIETSTWQRVDYWMEQEAKGVVIPLMSDERRAEYVKYGDFAEKNPYGNSLSSFLIHEAAIYRDEAFMDLAMQGPTTELTKPDSSSSQRSRKEWVETMIENNSDAIEVFLRNISRLENAKKTNRLDVIFQGYARFVDGFDQLDDGKLTPFLAQSKTKAWLELLLKVEGFLTDSTSDYSADQKRMINAFRRQVVMAYHQAHQINPLKQGSILNKVSPKSEMYPLILELFAPASNVDLLYKALRGRDGKKIEALAEHASSDEVGQALDAFLKNFLNQYPIFKNKANAYQMKKIIDEQTASTQKPNSTPKPKKKL